MLLLMKSEKLKNNQLSGRLIRAPFIAGFLLLPCVLFGLFKFVTALNPETYATYNELMVNAGVKKSDVKAAPYQVKQQRTKVQKDLLFTENENRMQLRLIAESSQMVLDHHDQSTEIVEHMNQVVCHMQEELYYTLPNGDEAIISKDNKLILRNHDPKDAKSHVSKDTPGLKPMQIVRVLEADVGAYYYKSDLFHAENVKIQRFIMDGHEFTTGLTQTKKIMNGIADSAQFSLDGKNMNFKANKLKATFYGPTVGAK